jgi:hypothetical protein
VEIGRNGLGILGVKGLYTKAWKAKKIHSYILPLAT